MPRVGESVALPDVPDSVLLEAVVDRLIAGPAVELPGPVALERTRTLLVQAERLRAAALDGVRDLDHRELYALHGAGSAAGWLRTLRVGSRGAPLSLARRLAGRRQVMAALAAGALDVIAAERVCGALDRLPDDVDEATVLAVLQEGLPCLLQELSGGSEPDREGTAAVLDGCVAATACPAGERLEPALVLLATRAAPQLLTRTLNYLLDALLPEQHLERWEDEQARTDLQLRELLDGFLDVRGLLDPETGAALRAALARRTAPMGGLADPRVGSTAGQRRVLALRQLLRDAAAGRGEQPLTLQPDPADVPAGWDVDGWAEHDAGEVEADLDAADPDAEAFVALLAEGPSGAGARTFCPGGAVDGGGVQLTLVTGERAGPPPGPEVPLSDTPPVPVLASIAAVLGLPGALPGRFGPRLATSLPVDALRRLGCGSTLAAVVLDAVGRPLAASGNHRNATERERRALLAQWGGQCATDGCPNAGSVPHHVEPWWLSKRTRLRDLVPYCDSCHHDTHEGQKTIRLRNGRWISPTGWSDPPGEHRLAG